MTFEHPAHNRWCGFPFRTKDGHLYWPLKGSGVYWSVEIEAAQKLDAKVTFWQIWQAEKCCDCKPYSWVEPLHEFRKSLGKGIEGFPIKLGLNALYGKQAQRKGARTYHNLLHAGLITAITRAKLISAIALDPDAVVMVATDAVYSTRPLRGLEIGDTLGAWEHGKEQIHPDMFIVQPGLYWFPKESASDRSHKTRGIPKSIIQQNAPAFLAAWEQYQLDCIEQMQRTFLTSLPPVPEQFDVPVPITTFIGLRLARHRNNFALAGRWLDTEKKMSFDWTLKRARGELNGTFVEHWPIEGDVNARSTCYDDNLLTELEQRNLEIEVMPDFVKILDHE